MAIGMVWLRGTMRSTSPPMVSKPSDSGITSSSSRSPLGLLPASWLAWIAAPSATTSSGFRLVSGGLPKNSATACCTCGMRVAPPTITTPLTSSRSSLASRSALRVATRVRAVSAAVTASKSPRLTSSSSGWPFSVTEKRVCALAVSASLVLRAAILIADFAAGSPATRPFCSRIQSAKARS